MNQAKTVLRSFRPPFLLLTPACVLLGVASASLSPGPIEPIPAALILLGALAAHISVNTFNEYFDFKSGLDQTTQRTPFSGGSGALVEEPNAAQHVLLAAVASLLLTVAIGIYFMLIAGTVLLPLGLAGVAIIITYTQWLNRSPWLCLIAPGIGFGLLMVTGTHLVLRESVSFTAVLLSLVPFFLVNNLLLLNQIPDITADRAAGRNHLPIAYGINASVSAYGLFTLAAGACIVGCALSPKVSNWALLALLPLIAGGMATLIFARFARAGDKTDTDLALLMPALPLNVICALLTPTTLALAIFIT